MTAPLDPAACAPCRGTGAVISQLGGSLHEVTCPWCGGSGRFRKGPDTQAGDETRWYPAGSE